jgi:hypothetical protein
MHIRYFGPPSLPGHAHQMWLSRGPIWGRVLPTPKKSSRHILAGKPTGYKIRLRNPCKHETRPPLEKLCGNLPSIERTWVLLSHCAERLKSCIPCLARLNSRRFGGSPSTSSQSIYLTLAEMVIPAHSHLLKLPGALEGLHFCLV